MKTQIREGMKLEIKYCENCGVLWIRESGESFVYCRTCREICKSHSWSWQTSISPERRRPVRTRRARIPS